MFAPDSALDLLKCGVCSRYLSCFPIYFSKDMLTLCGRCYPHFKQDCHVRNTPYEALAEHLKFPCTYEPQGCLEKLTPSNMLDHEAQCPFRTASCVSPNCLWKGSINELREHYEEVHPALIFKNGKFEVDILNSYEIINLIIFEEEMFTLKRMYDDQKKLLRFEVSCVYLIDTTKKYKYEVIFENASKSHSVKVDPKTVDIFEAGSSKILVSSLKKALDDPSLIIGNIVIDNVLDFGGAPEEISGNVLKSDSEMNLKMLSELECPVCFEYMIPPIYQCITGHTICSACKQKEKECPTCGEEFKNTQNFTLEKMSKFLLYPCKYDDDGCNFSAKPHQIRDHERFCFYAPHFCPLNDYENCKWENRSTEIMPHIFAQHHDNMLDIDVITVYIGNNYYLEKESNCYILQYANRIFKLHYLYKENTFNWSMQLLGSPEDSNKFKFEIDVIDATNKGQRLFVRSFCSPFTDKEHSFEVPSQYVFFELNQINTLITNTLSYRVRVIKQ